MSTTQNLMNENTPAPSTGRSQSLRARGAHAVEWLPLQSLLPYARNAKTHSAAQVTQIASSIKTFGFNNPVLIDEGGEIIAGHGRVIAAHQLQMPRVPCIVLKHLNKAKKRAFRLADNRIAENSGWDLEMLKMELTDTQVAGLEVDLGFTEIELQRALGELEELDTSPRLSQEMQFRVVVDCADESQQKQLLIDLEARGFSCRPLIS